MKATISHPAFFSLLLIIAISVNTEALFAQKKKVKEIIGWESSPEYKEAQKVLVKRFNTNGQLTHQNQPTFYCQQDYKYDSLNRLIYEENFCGETFGNGSCRYIYRGNKLYIVEDLVASQKNETVVFDPKGRKTSSSMTHEVYYESKRDSVFSTFLYAPNGLLIRHDKISFTEYGQFDDNNVFIGESKEEKLESTSYYYNDKDSLILEITVDLRAGFVTEKKAFAYNKNTGKLLKSVHYRQDSESENGLTEYDKTDYVWNTDGSMAKTRRFFKGSLSQEESYTYKDGQLWQKWEKTFSTYGDDIGQEGYKSQHIYKDGLEIRQKNYDASGNQSSITDFQYTFYD